MADMYAADTLRPQVQDPWGRSPGSPDYGQDPQYGGQTKQDLYDSGVLPQQDVAPPASGLLPTPPADATTQPVPTGAAPASGAFMPYTGAAGDQAATKQWVINQANAYGQSSIAANPDYWVAQINKVGGVGDGQYWADRIKAGGAGGDQPGSSSLTSAMTPYMQSMTGMGASSPTLASQYVAQGFSQPTASNTLKGTLENLLMQRATQSLDINKADPIIRNQEEAYNARQQQGRRNYLAETAEKQGPYGNIGAEARASAETVGQNTSDFEAHLMQQELTARRQEIQMALSGMQGYITDEERMALQAQLAQMDNALGYARLNEQASEFGQNLSQNAYMFDTTRYDNLFG